MWYGSSSRICCEKFHHYPAQAAGQYQCLSASITPICLHYSSISQNPSCPWGILLGNWPPGLLSNSWNFTLQSCHSTGICSWRQQGTGAFKHSLPLMDNRTVALPSLVPTPACNSWALARFYFYTVIALIIGISASTFGEGEGSSWGAWKRFVMCSTEIFISMMKKKKKIKYNPCVWYSWSTSIFSTFVKQGNSEVSTKGQNTAVPQPAFDSPYTYVFRHRKVPQWGWLPFVIQISELFWDTIL